MRFSHGQPFQFAPIKLPPFPSWGYFDWRVLLPSNRKQQHYRRTFNPFAGRRVGRTFNHGQIKDADTIFFSRNSRSRGRSSKAAHAARRRLPAAPLWDWDWDRGIWTLGSLQNNKWMLCQGVVQRLGEIHTLFTRLQKQHLLLHCCACCPNPLSPPPKEIPWSL